MNDESRVHTLIGFNRECGRKPLSPQQSSIATIPPSTNPAISPPQFELKNFLFENALSWVRSTTCCVGLFVFLVAGCHSPKVDNATQAEHGEIKVQEIASTHGYVPDDQCESCHQDLYRSYQQVGMAKSFYPPGKQPQIEDFHADDYFHRASNRYYGMRTEKGELFQYRYQVDSEGNRFNELEVRVDAILGSGNHVRSYLYRTESGELFQMPLAWYSKAKVWRMNPGYDNPDHLGFQRKVNRECMFCHNAYPLDVEAGSDQYWQPDVFGTIAKLPHGIGCQRCHGPGEQHIELASGGGSNESILDSILNPSDLAEGLGDDVCFQCHMQPSSQILSELVRKDRAEYSFRPGETLKDYRALLDYVSIDESPDEERFEINHHAYRIKQSACVDDAGSSLSCVTCHDPHRVVAPEERLVHFRSVCIECHKVASCESAAAIELPREVASQAYAEQKVDDQAEMQQVAVKHAPLADCVQCHMPTRRTHDVVHAVMTDHRIVARTDSSEQRLAARPEPPPPPQNAKVFAYKASGSEDNANSEEMEVYEAIAGSQIGNEEALKRLITYVREKGDQVELMPLAELADALRKFGDEQGALEVNHRAVQLYPDHMRTHLELAMSLAAAGDHETAYLYYQRALNIGPPLPETYVGLGMTLLNRNDLVGATKHFREAVRLRPYYPEALLNLGIALFARREWEESREYLSRALAADPTFVEANEYLSRIPSRE